MNYLTNYYRNLSEQLQEKINILEAKINRPTWTVLGDTFRNDESQDQRVLQRSQVMSDLHAFTTFKGADEESRLSAAKVLQDMQAPAGTGTDASRDDLRRALTALKMHGSSDAFRSHAAQTLSGYAERGVRDVVVGNNDMNMKTVRRVDYDVGSGIDALAKETFGDDPVSVGGLQRSSKQIAGVMGPQTGSVKDFIQQIQNPNVINTLGQLATYSDDPWTVKRGGQSVAREFPGRFETTVLSNYWNKGGERRVKK